MMFYLLIMLLLVILAGLVWLQKQREQVWHAEWQQLSHLHVSKPISDQHEEATYEKKPSHSADTNVLTFHIVDHRESSACEENEVIDFSMLNQLEDGALNVTAMETSASSSSSGDTKSANQSIPSDETKTLEHSIDIDNQLIFNEVDLSNAATAVSQERETITLQEATRLVNQPLSTANLHSTNTSLNQNIATIEANDPSIIRVRHQTRTETELLLKNSSAKSHMNSETVRLPESKTIQTIDIEEIQKNLQLQRQARQRLAGSISTNQIENIQTTLAEIRADEIWANLSRTNIPATRRRQQSVQQALSTTQQVDEQVTTTFTPQNNRYATMMQIKNQVPNSVETPPPVLPSTATSEPTFVPSYPISQQKPIEATPIAKPIDYHAVSTEHHLTPSLDDLAQKDELTEEDFAAYYHSQTHIGDFELNDTDDNSFNENTTEKINSWASTWHTDNTDMQRDMLPPLSLLLPAEHNPEAVPSPEALLDNSITIEEKLAEYRVKVKVLDAYAGPVITRYEIEPDVGVRGNSVINLEKDLARSLGVASIRVVETIPGKTCMGLELPNPKRQMIRISEVFNSEAFINSASKLTLALGQDIIGEPVVTDLAKAPHLLVAGTTGSGKSVGVNSMILSMLYKATPDDVRMIMIDPKMLELSVYEGIPHLLAPVVTDMTLAANALNWCVNEMEKRYRLMSHLGVRNIAGYNQKIREANARGQNIANPFSFTPDDPEPLEKLPFIVVIVDEFADLMMTAGKQIEQLIARLAQKARAAGIHLILATQRPSVDVITGLIKANIPTRIAFQVSTKIDSRTILDQMGAENLLGQGDMLFLPPGTGYPKRVHGAFVADSEVHHIVEYLKQFGEPDYIDDILSPEQPEFNFGSSGSDGKDPLFDQAVEFVLRTQKTSISALQRQMRIGYNKAAIIVEQMEEEGILSSPDHSGKRQILAHRHED